MIKSLLQTNMIYESGRLQSECLKTHNIRVAFNRLRSN